MAKNHRKHTRKTRKTHKKRASRRQRGGAADLQPAGANWTTANFSLPQGVEFAKMHVGQHGGGENATMPQLGLNKAQFGGAAPVGYTGMLDDGLRASARVDATFAQYGQIAGLKDADQAGGRRRRKARKTGRKSRKAGRKSRKAGRKSRKARGSRRRQRGGALAPAPVGWVENGVPTGVNPQFRSWDASA